MQTLAYTVGEPAGIGADIILQLAQLEKLNDVVAIADRELLTMRAQKLGLQIEMLEQDQSVDSTSQLRVLHQPFADNLACGVPNTDNVPAVLTMLDTAIDGCLNGEYSAMITGPLHKGIINQAGIEFSGHTEYLCERTKAKLPVMLLATDELRVALVTTHLPLKDVSAAITKQRIQDVCEIIHRDFQNRFGIAQPRLLVCGLNPHAGEGGHIGREEIEVIEPALAELRKQGLSIEGPLPADTLFTPRVLERGDVAVAMYHDQGLPVLKFHGFSKAANITLGLPIIRTSVDHGTAFDLAGTGQADLGSLRTAINVARELCNR